MENLKEMVDVNTIVGDPVETPDGSVILPVSKVGFGFAAGGSEFDIEDQKQQNTDQQDKSQLPFGGGSGGGVSITPVAFLIVNASGIRMVHIDGQTHLYDKILDSAPQIFEKIQSMIGNNNKKQKLNGQEKNSLSADELGL